MSSVSLQHIVLHLWRCDVDIKQRAIWLTLLCKNKFKEICQVNHDHHVMKKIRCQGRNPNGLWWQSLTTYCLSNITSSFGMEAPCTALLSCIQNRHNRLSNNIKISIFDPCRRHGAVNESWNIMKVRHDGGVKIGHGLFPASCGSYG